MSMLTPDDLSAAIALLDSNRSQLRRALSLPGVTPDHAARIRSYIAKDEASIARFRAALQETLGTDRVNAVTGRAAA